MNDTKPAITSSGLVGSTGTILSGLALEVFTKPEILAQLPTPWLPWFIIGGGLLSFFGRLFAKKEIKGVISTPG